VFGSKAYMLQKEKTYDVIFEEMINQMPTTSDVANFIIDPNFLNTMYKL